MSEVDSVRNYDLNDGFIMIYAFLLPALAVAGNSALFFFDKSLSSYGMGATVLVALFVMVFEVIN